jgi:hypothetical protein
LEQETIEIFLQLMKILKVRFYSKLSLLIVFLVFLVLVGIPAFYLRTAYLPDKLSSLAAIVFGIAIMSCAILIEIVIGIFTTYWTIDETQAVVNWEIVSVFLKRHQSFAFEDLVSVKTKCITNKFERLTIILSNGKRIKLYHSIFSNKNEFRMLARTLRKIKNRYTSSAL